MIAKMKFVNITGPKEDIDRVARTYLNKYPIHLENALTELSAGTELTPCNEANPYKSVMVELTAMAKIVNHGDLNKPRQQYAQAGISLEDAKALIQELNQQSADLKASKEQLIKKRTDLQEVQKNLAPYKDLDLNVANVLKFKSVKFRFGRMPLGAYEQFMADTYETMTTLFQVFYRDENYVWGVYFTPKAKVAEAEAIFSSKHFERVFFPDIECDTPKEDYQRILGLLEENHQAIEDCDNSLSTLMSSRCTDINKAYGSMAVLSENFDIRKKAAYTKDRFRVFYILCGWMEAADAKAFEEEASKDPDTFVMVADSAESSTCIPPTKIVNKGLFKPFQLFVDMYGLPNYNELDPTKFLALTYALMFGIMFGDAGQGLVLLLGGLFLYKKKGMRLAGIISFCGLFSVGFGILYSSFFGFEDLWPAVWSPMSRMMPTLIVAVAFGIILILVDMIIHMVNAHRMHNTGDIFFGANGLSGLIFYALLIYMALGVVLPTIGPGPFAVCCVILMLVCLLGITFKEPLADWLAKRKFEMETTKGMFFMESFFELFEVFLTYLTNTISFIRIGAFALSHAGMMSVVILLSNIESGISVSGILIMVLGNIIVSGMEGLIVGIQVLRLEYYEMFGRFYQGGGKAFEPYEGTLITEAVQK